MFNKTSKIKPTKDISRDNLSTLIDLYDQYRQMQYDLFKQYNLCLEDPHFDTVYLNIEPLEHYRKYIEEDLNGTDNHSSTTEIIKEFKKLLESYDATLDNYTKNNSFKPTADMVN